jgi:MFS family permease
MAALNAVTSVDASSQEQSNFHHLVVEIAWFGIAFPATSRFLQIYAIRLGADAELLAWMAALPALILLISASLGERWLRRYRDSTRATLLPGLGFRLSFLLPALTPFVPASFQSWWLLLSIALPAIPQGVASVTFLVMFREGVSQKLIEPLLSKRMMAINGALAASGLAMGLWLEKTPFPLNYQVMFIFAFAAALISHWHVCKVRVIPELAVRSMTSHQASVNPWRSQAFQVVAFVIVLSFASFTVNLPFVNLHLTRNLGASEGFMGLYALVELVAAAGMGALTHQVVQRTGNRLMIALMMIGTALSTLIVATAAHLPLTLLAAGLGGAAWTGVNIGIFAFFSETTPAEHKAPFTTAYNQVIFLSMFVGPLIGRALQYGGSSLVALLVTGAFLRLIAGVLIQMHFRVWLRRALSFNQSHE